jgi:hypothetical protein
LSFLTTLRQLPNAKLTMSAGGGIDRMGQDRDLIEQVENAATCQHRAYH